MIKVRNKYYKCDCLKAGCRYCDSDGKIKENLKKSMEDLNKKRLEQKKETWIKNVIKVQNLSPEKAEELYNKIKPYK